MKYFSLFSGIGGFELGITQAYEAISKSDSNKCEVHTEQTNGGYLPNDRSDNMEKSICVGYSEIDKYAIQIYQEHFPKHHNYGDITHIDEQGLPDFELLCGGFPCQSFSIAGDRGGFDDTRGTLFFHIARIVKHKRPRLLLLENVKGLLSHDGGRTFNTVIAVLDELGYDLQWQVLDSKDFGVPQSRERVFIIGHLRGTGRPQVFPFSDANPKGIEQINHPTHSWDSYDFEGKIRRLTPLECERLQSFPDGWTEGVSDTQRYKCLGNAVTINVIRAITEKLL